MLFPTSVLSALRSSIAARVPPTVTPVSPAKPSIDSLPAWVKPAVTTVIEATAARGVNVAAREPSPPITSGAGATGLRALNQAVNARPRYTAYAYAPARIDPKVPVAPRIPTPMVTPAIKVVRATSGLGAAMKGILERVGAAGTPPPKPSEARKTLTLTGWIAQLKNILPQDRSVDPRTVAMAPRIDQSAPMLVGGPNAVLDRTESSGQSIGIQLDRTPALASTGGAAAESQPQSTSTGTGTLLLGGVIAFGLLILLRR